MNDKKRQGLREILAEIGTPEDIKEVDLAKSSKDVAKKIDGIDAKMDAVSTAEDLKAVLASFESFAKSNSKRQDALLQSFEKFTETLSKNLEKTGAAISGSVEKNRAKDLSGFFKDFGTQLASSAQSAKQSAELIQNLKWNASQQLRDTNGSPVNPAIAGFAITAAYDDIQLSNYDGSGNVGTVTYLQSGSVVAVLNLTYDGSGNLTDVTRTQ